MGTIPGYDDLSVQGILETYNNNANQTYGHHIYSSTNKRLDFRWTRVGSQMNWARWMFTSQPLVPAFQFTFQTSAWDHVEFSAGPGYVGIGNSNGAGNSTWDFRNTSSKPALFVEFTGDTDNNSTPAVRIIAWNGTSNSTSSWFGSMANATNYVIRVWIDPLAKRAYLSRNGTVAGSVDLSTPMATSNPWAASYDCFASRHTGGGGTTSESSTDIAGFIDDVQVPFDLYRSDNSRSPMVSS